VALIVPLIGSGEVQERIRYIHEKGKEILLVDLANCPPSEVADIARTVPNHLATQPRSSVLLLVNFTGATFDHEAIRAIKESAVFDKPYVKKSAWIGNIKEETHAEIRNFSRRELPVFNSIQQAISWLVK
jgi:hypothetical protein